MRTEQNTCVCHHSARTHDDKGCMVVCDCTATYEEAKETDWLGFACRECGTPRRHHGVDGGLGHDFEAMFA